MNERNYYYLDNFLSLAENNQLLDFAIANEANYTTSLISDNTPNFRKSKVLYNFDEFSRLIDCKLRKIFELVCHSLNVIPFQIDGIEIQLTAHNHGDYFKTHTDKGSPETNNRQLTYVYYFHKNPKPFDGGDLEIDGQILTPVNNRIVFFPSRKLHQVFPVICPSGSFSDSRFTVNGWMRSQISSAD